MKNIFKGKQQPAQTPDEAKEQTQSANAAQPADGQPAVAQAQQSKQPEKKKSKLQILSIIWTVFMFGFYIFKDVMQIKENGWTAVNIITTAFLALQIILFVVFTAIASKDKQDAKNRKNTLKWVKKIKKLSLKITTFVTSVLIIVGAAYLEIGILDIISIVVAGLSLLLFVISLIKLLIKEIIKYRLRKKMQKIKEKRAQTKAEKTTKK